MYAPSVQIYIDGAKSSEGVGCVAVFPDFDVFLSLPVVASIYTAEYVIFSSHFLAFCSTPVIFSSFILTPDVHCRPLGVFIHTIP